jgi:glycosyltransferase involved in cell wall biosynthesis
VSDLRIYIAISTFLPLVGGSEKQALAHGRSLQKRGFVPTIITLCHDRNWLSHEVIDGVPVIRVASTVLEDRKKLPGPLRRLLYLAAVLIMSWKLWRHRHHYDVLHLYHLGFEALPIALVCRLTGKPFMISVRCADSGRSVTLHGKASLLAGELDANAPWLQVDERVRMEGDLVKLESLGKTVKQFTRFLFQNIHVVIVILSSRMKDYLTAHDFNLPHVHLIPNGVDITRFYPMVVDTPGDKVAQVVICIARLSYEKGIDVLLQAWHLVHKQAPQARLIVVGHGPLHNQLECMARALDIADSVEFTGLQSDVAAQLRRGSLAVLPSRWEGMPNALLEAMACGLACVSTRVSGSEDIIQHEVNGLLVEPEDYQGMAWCLLTLLQNPLMVQKYGHAGRSTIEKYYELEQITDRYVELYQSMAGPGSQNIEIEEATQPPEISHLSSSIFERI